MTKFLGINIHFSAIIPIRLEYPKSAKTAQTQKLELTYVYDLFSWNLLSKEIGGLSQGLTPTTRFKIRYG